MANLTLDDILAAPQDPALLNQHLQNLGLITPPPTLPAETVAPMAKPNIPSDVSPMTPPVLPEAEHLPEYTGRARDLALGATSQPVAPMVKPMDISGAPDLGVGDDHEAGNPMKPLAPPVTTENVVGKPLDGLEEKLVGGGIDHPNPLVKPEVTSPIAPDLGTGTGAAPSVDGLVKPMTPPALSEADKAKLPSTSVGAPAGSTGALQNQVEKDQWKKDNPWGTENNHPGFLGKLAHGLATVGETAGAIVAPGAVMQIPGSRLNNNAHLEQDLGNLRASQANDRANATATSEAGLRTAQATNLNSEATDRDLKAGQQDVVRDQAGNITGWKGKDGLHALDDPNTPQAIKTIAETEQTKPRYETDKVSGNIVKITPGKNGEADKSEVVYKGTPGLKTETRSVIGPDKKPHDQVFDITPNSPTFGKSLADLGVSKQDKQPSVASELAKEKAGEEVVLAYDKDNKAHLMSKADAEEEGMQHITKAASGDIDKAKTHHVVLNTLQTQLNGVVNARDALDQNAFQRGIISAALAHPSNGFIDSELRQTILGPASEKTKDYVQAVIALREAGLALPKEITGGSRVSEVQASALWAGMPSAGSLDSKYALKQAHKFQQDIDRLRNRAPLVRGQEMVDPDDAIKDKGTEKTHTTNGPQAGGNFKVPDGAPDASSLADGKVLRDASGNKVAKVQGGKWVAP